MSTSCVDVTDNLRGLSAEPSLLGGDEVDGLDE